MMTRIFQIFFDSTRRRWVFLAVGAVTILWIHVAKADAIMMTRAMSASTIAEIFIEKDHVRVELEIGLADLDAFHNLIPDDLLQSRGVDASPFAERLPRFFSEDFTIRPDDGPPIPGALQSMESRQRIKRDDITGEPIPSDEEDNEAVLAATLIYPFENNPKTLAIKPPTDKRGIAAANIGFVAYHSGLPINDFRYLSGEPTVDLDWEDAWYSKFRHRNLWRAYNSPINVFLYVEPYEVRVEVIVRPKDLQQWTDLGVEGRDVLPVEMQPELKVKVGTFLGEHVRLNVDGRDVSPSLDRINFLKRTLRTSRVIEPPEELGLESATLGVIFVYPTSGFPQHAALTWDLFSPKLPEVRAAATDQAGPMPFLLNPTDNVLEWKNFLKNPTIPKLINIKPPAALVPLSVPVASSLCILLLIPICVRVARRRHPTLLVSASILLIITVVAWPHARVSVANPLAKLSSIPDGETREVVGALLKNIYVAFEFRDERAIYDTLERSADGDLLTQIYLETKKSLELQSQGGARVKVKEVDLIKVDQKNLKWEIGFVATCKWNVRGSVGHWGHIHERINQYEARIRVIPVDGVWKIVDLEMLNEERIF